MVRVRVPSTEIQSVYDHFNGSGNLGDNIMTIQILSSYYIFNKKNNFDISIMISQIFTSDGE